VKPDGRYSRIYHEAVDDERFREVWPDDGALALWVRLLVLADGAWPASVPIPRTAKPRPLSVLVEAGLVRILPGDLFRVNGLDAERGRRQSSARNAAAVRWGMRPASESQSDP
jgi:hypothetical protein